MSCAPADSGSSVPDGTGGKTGGTGTGGAGATGSGGAGATGTGGAGPAGSGGAGATGSGGATRILSYRPPEGWEVGDVVAYRCPDCNERFDVVLDEDDEENARPD